MDGGGKGSMLMCLLKNSLLVKAWNYSSWPAYKSRFWNKGEGGEQQQQQQAQVQARVP